MEMQFFKLSRTPMKEDRHDIAEEYRCRVDNYIVVQEIDKDGNHRLRVSNRIYNAKGGVIVFSSWVKFEEFSSIDLDETFGTTRGWSIVGCTKHWNKVFARVFKTQLGVQDCNQALPSK